MKNTATTSTARGKKCSPTSTIARRAMRLKSTCGGRICFKSKSSQCCNQFKFSPRRKPMPIEIIDMVDFAHKEKKRKEIFNTPRFHAWMHYYQPGHKDELHCHNADQTFFVIDGE